VFLVADLRRAIVPDPRDLAILVDDDREAFRDGRSLVSAAVELRHPPFHVGEQAVLRASFSLKALCVHGRSPAGPAPPYCLTPNLQAVILSLHSELIHRSFPC